MKPLTDDTGAQAAEPKAKKERKSRAKNKPTNQDLPNMTGPGVEKPSIPELDKLANDYAKKRDARMAETKPEVAAKQKLLDAMHRHADALRVEREGKSVLLYEYDDKMVEVQAKEESVKVRTRPEYKQGDMD